MMSELLSGTKPLRGRAELNLRIDPFDYRAAAAFWGVERDPELAFQLHAVIGGTPGYRDLVQAVRPGRASELDDWLAATILNPSHALFGELEYLLREDPRITARALYHAVLAAISAGATAPTAIAARLGRDVRSLTHPLDVLETAGLVQRDEDVLRQRRPTYTVADPIARFHQLISRPGDQASSPS